MNKANEQLIILGSSRANHHYVPTVFSDSLRVSAYNAGRDQQGILYHYCVLKNVLARKSTRLVILDLLPDEFAYNPTTYNALSELLPYYNSHKELRPIINMRSYFEEYKSLSSLYRYNSLISTIIVNNILTRKDTSVQGYLPLGKKWKGSPKNVDVKPDDLLDSVKIKIFESFLSDAKNAGVKVFVFVSPRYEKTTTITSSIRKAKEICDRSSVVFNDFSQDKYFLERPDLFQNANHLNDTGAGLYSRQIASEIKSYLAGRGALNFDNFTKRN